MDNIYVIGYRIDIKDANDFKLAEALNKAGFNVGTLPGKKFMIWDSTHQNGASLWIMEKGHPLKVDYRCPISRDEIWQDLRNKKTFDIPSTFASDFESLKNENIYKWLIDNNYPAKITWGVAIMLG